MRKEKWIDFIILSLRWYLIFYMLDYGWGKLTMTQFNVTNPTILAKPLSEVNSFYVAWHLFGRSPFFNVATGLLEIIGGILLMFNRTALIGALLALSILGQIFIIDVAFTTDLLGFSLPFRIAGMILADIFILYYYRSKVVAAWKSLTQNITTKFKYKWWVYLLLPIIGFLTDFAIGIGSLPLRMLVNWMVYSA
ncbi:MAG: putative membrane protein YphA (DoxX/SURF4 family) [Flavobacteriales bacterium]|jgi:uncharacterized membrane protein YphA (DoxX/SURF4 family)